MQEDGDDEEKSIGRARIWIESLAGSDAVISSITT
jgi:hypothetical protein